MKVSIYYDFRCPFANNMTNFLGKAQSQGISLDITWIPFSLALNNSRKENSNVNFKQNKANWNAFVFFEWVQLKYPDKTFEVIQEIFKARHQLGNDHNSLTTLEKVALSCGLERIVIKDILKDKELYDSVEKKHFNGVKLGVFGVPTLVYDNNNIVFIKMLLPDDKDVKNILYTLETLIEKQTIIGEIKRPQPPWPV